MQLAPAEKASLEPNIIVYKAVTDGKDPVYQWSSTVDANVSYSIAFDTHVPVGTTGQEITVANFTRAEKISRATMIGLLTAIKDPKERQNAEAAIANGDSFTVSQRGADNPNYSWSSFSNSLVNYTITVNAQAVRSAEANF